MKVNNFWGGKCPSILYLGAACYREIIYRICSHLELQQQGGK